MSDEALLSYRLKAEKVVDRVARRWRHEDGSDDLRALGDAVHRALVDEANLELRQILARMSGELEMAVAKNGMSADKASKLLDGVSRASALMEVFLDRANATKLTIRLDVDDFDLGDALDRRLRLQGLRDRVRANLAPCVVRGDRDKLLDALGHVASRFYLAARRDETVLVSLAPRADGTAEGFLGLTSSHLKVEQLMQEIHSPIDVEDMGIEIAYVRAVVERHGGSLFVATADGGSSGSSAAVGFGFTLPLLAGGP